MNFIIRDFAQIQFFHDQKHNHQFKHYQTHECETDITRVDFFDERKNRNHHCEKHRKKKIITDKSRFKTSFHQKPYPEVQKKHDKKKDDI